MNDLILKTISLGAIVIIVCVLCLMVLDFFKIQNPIKKIKTQYRLEMLFLVSLAGTVGSLLLSIYFKLSACELCWYQRVFLFCIPVITAIALLKKDTKAQVYVFWLSIIGLLLSTYHSLIQSGLFASSDAVFCNPNALINCAVPAFVYFGFVTIPVIAFSAFLLLSYISYESYKK